MDAIEEVLADDDLIEVTRMLVNIVDMCDAG